MTPRGPLGGFTLERFSALDGTLWSALLGEWWNLLRLGGNPLCSGSGGEGADFTSAVNESFPICLENFGVDRFWRVDHPIPFARGCGRHSFVFSRSAFLSSVYVSINPKKAQKVSLLHADE